MRGLRSSDAPALVGLMSRCDATYRQWAPAGWEPPDGEPETARLCERLRDPEHWSVGAFDADELLVAAVMWEGLQNLERPEAPSATAYVSAVFVEPVRWRQGIATVLLDQAEEAMRQRGHHLARLWTPEGAPARRFYEGHGWRHDGRRTWHGRLRLAHVGYQKQLRPGRPKGLRAPTPVA